MARPSPTINVMTGAARKAARRLVRDFGEVEQLQVSRKGPADFVSTADIEAERTIRRELERARPGCGFLMEESEPVAGDGTGMRWIVDPLDGTTNFLHGLPHFAISIALERNGELIAGVVYEPIKDEMFWAERGLGAYLNDRRIRVSARRHMNESLFATGIPFLGTGEHGRYLATQRAVMGESAGIRRWGVASLDLAYVAAGRYDGYWEFGLQPWDIAAGIVLVREAGGLVSDMRGAATMLDSGDILAVNEALHTPLGRLIRDALANVE